MMMMMMTMMVVVEWCKGTGMLVSMVGEFCWVNVSGSVVWRWVKLGPGSVIFMMDCSFSFHVVLVLDEFEVPELWMWTLIYIRMPFFFGVCFGFEAEKTKCCRKWLPDPSEDGSEEVRFLNLLFKPVCFDRTFIWTLRSQNSLQRFHRNRTWTWVCQEPERMFQVLEWGDVGTFHCFQAFDASTTQLCPKNGPRWELHRSVC